jgi:predicted acetyltransferase
MLLPSLAKSFGHVVWRNGPLQTAARLCTKPGRFQSTGEPVDERPKVTVAPAKASERPLIEALFQLYSYDWSEMEPPGSASFAVDGEGRFKAYPYMEEYWREKDRWPLIIRAGDEVAGFALVNTHSHLGAKIDRNMAEFFVLRKHRRQGVAAEAAHLVFAAHPGRWEVAVATRNTTARAFWARAIASAPGVSDLREEQGDGVTWKGPVWCFRVSSNGS